MAIDKFEEPREDDADEGFLASRTALVTGGAKRIGRELALALAAEGAHVIVHHHTSGAEAKATVKEIIKLGGTADRIAGDLTDATVAENLVKNAAEKCGNPVDILVNNAAIFERIAAAATKVDLWDRMQSINLRAPFLLAQSFAAQLPNQWDGDIININDARSLAGDPQHFAYAVSKIGLNGLTKSLALSLAPQIRVNELSLGAVMAPSGATEYLKTKKAELPAGSFPQIGDITTALMFLLSTSGVSGQTIRLDGGQHGS